MNQYKKHYGFSLIEILVVVSILSLLLGILLPSLHTTRQQAQRILCLNNLRQMVMAAQTYSSFYDDHYPIAYFTERVNGIPHYLAWDFNTWKNWSESEPIEYVEPGLLWMGKTIDKIQQCPVFQGSDNWFDDPFTGYNYNISYIGLNETVRPMDSVKVTEVRSPPETAIFGDGEYTEGANKFMRAPFPNPRDESFSDTGRYAGVQGFRHLHTTNVAFCDGHVHSQHEIYTNTNQTSREILEQHNQTNDNKIGFLSIDNRLYDLK